MPLAYFADKPAMRWAFAMLFFFLLAGSTQAEVRVFLLRIAKKSDPQDFRLIKSTLDPLQYGTYYPVSPDEVVTYDDTWRCKGRTGDFKDLCPSPREASAAESSPSQGPEKQP